MSNRLIAAFLDFATMGPNVSTVSLDAIVDTKYFAHSRAEELRERLATAEIAIINKVKLDRETIVAAPRLRLIALSATGTDNVDCRAAEERGVAVANTRGYASAAVAQHVFALVLALTNHVARYDALVRADAWRKSPSFALFDYPIHELTGRTLGVVGFGALGRAVAALGRCFAMEVLISTRFRDEPAEGRVPFTTILRTADIVSLHCPLTQETHHMIGAAELARMKPNALLINTARGGLIDGKALAAALKNGTIGGAGIDVLPVEPPGADEPLLATDIPNLLITPHIAWAAREARQRALEQVAENIAAFLNGKRLRRVV
jgi:glycerate dehydrogenase